MEKLKACERTFQDNKLQYYILVQLCDTYSKLLDLNVFLYPIQFSLNVSHDQSLVICGKQGILYY